MWCSALVSELIFQSVARNGSGAAACCFLFVCAWFCGFFSQCDWVFRMCIPAARNRSACSRQSDVCVCLIFFVGGHWLLRIFESYAVEGKSCFASVCVNFFFWGWLNFDNIWHLCNTGGPKFSKRVCVFFFCGGWLTFENIWQLCSRGGVWIPKCMCVFFCFFWQWLTCDTVWQRREIKAYARGGVLFHKCVFPAFLGFGMSLTFEYLYQPRELGGGVWKMWRIVSKGCVFTDFFWFWNLTDFWECVSAARNGRVWGGYSQ